MNIDYTQRLLSDIITKVKKLKSTSSLELAKPTPENKVGYDAAVRDIANMLISDREKLIEATKTLKGFNIPIK
jgi:hypothetical protein